MNPQNLLAAYQGRLAIAENSLDVGKGFICLKEHEAETLKSFCDQVKSQCDDFDVFNNFYIGYSIPQISKEFDLLRFGDDSVVNIELKSELDEKIKIEKITKQMKKNCYYLKFLNKELHLYTYVQNDGIYKYVREEEKVVRIDFEELVEVLKEQQVDSGVVLEKEFIPSHYLISPFNKTKQFMDNEYFLTPDQEKTKKEIIESIREHKHSFYCISANAGTGKTLLVYDIAKEFIKNKYKTLIIHCGILNGGHESLNLMYKWNVNAIKDIVPSTIDDKMRNIQLVVIDEAQRIRDWQLHFIVKRAEELHIPIIFSYDTKQYLSENENTDIYEYLLEHHVPQGVYFKKLTNKIRTNKSMASFIRNLMKMGSCNENLDFKNITVEYFDNFGDVTRYIDSLNEKDGWKAITFTSSQYNWESISQISTVCHTNAHKVIGQEFDKVVFIMDNNFNYNSQNYLECKDNYYSGRGMLYQIVTRVVNELKIIVLNNPALYEDILKIKGMG